MILGCGIPSEPPLAALLLELRRLQAPFAVFNQRHFASMEMTFDIRAGRVSGDLRIDELSYRLEDFGAVYSRLIDASLLPESARSDDAQRLRCRRLHECMTYWQDVANCPVVNRPSAMASNYSKPLQAQMAREHGFDLPATLITNEPDLVREFSARHARVIFKSLSGVRSIVRLLRKEDLDRLDRIRWCPVQFQEFIDGNNVRVHIVDGDVFATEIVSQATDYRYPGIEGHRAPELRPFELPDDLARRSIQLTRSLGLVFSGIDLKLSPDGRVVCLEVNPSPVFTYFQAHTDQPIAQALAHYLIDADG